MTIAFNYDNVQTLTNPVLIGNNTQLTGGSVDGLPSITLSGGNPVSTVLELQSTESAILLTRMTSTQRDAISTPADGMQFYNTTLGKMQAREGGSWVTLSNSSGGTFVADAGTAAAPSYTFTGDLDTGMYLVAANTIGFSSVGALQFKVSPTTSAVNFVEVTGAAAGQTPILGVSGTDGNVSLDVVLKNTGTLNIKGDDPSNTPGTIRFYSQDNGEYTALTTAEPANNATFKLPPSMPAATDGGLVPLRCDSLGEMTFNPDGAIIHQRTLVTSASVKTMFTLGVSVIPAPPAGKTILLHNSLLRLKAGTAYANGGAIKLQYGSTGGGAGITATAATMPASILASTNARIGNLLGALPEQDVNNVSGLGIFISCDTADFINGTGDMYIDTWFSIIPALP